MSGRPWPAPRWLAVLLVGLRLGALALYRPGGYIAVAPPYPALPAWLDARLDLLTATSDLSRQLAVGLLMLPFEVATLLLLYRLARFRWSEARARRTALFWALLWLPLSAWLQRADTVGVALLLGVLVLMGAPTRTVRAPRHWLWPALALTLLVPFTGEALLYLLPFLALLLPTVRGALLAIALMLLDALVTTIGPALLPPASGALLVARLALIGVALLLAWEWVHQLHRRRVPRPSRPGAHLAIIAVVLLLTAPLALRDYRAARLAHSAFAPLVSEWEQAPGGTILLNHWDLYDELYAWVGSRYRMSVVTERNRAALETQLARTPGPVWIVARHGVSNPEFSVLRAWLASQRITTNTTTVGTTTVERFGLDK
ncbi:MAG: hypothetical protein M5U01_31890 [Ardenticatenaceae bacterium]|nr:hypothetical protein [Ardenticatenaceae bacterium]HBY95197.1 hypothetical protein [Chloroflexota bacterium]